MLESGVNNCDFLSFNQSESTDLNEVTMLLLVFFFYSKEMLVDVPRLSKNNVSKPWKQVTLCRLLTWTST